MARTLSRVVRNVLFTVVVPGLGGAWVPWRILTRDGHAPAPVAWAATVVIAAGIALYVWCAWNFAAAGGGTPGPWGAPRPGAAPRAQPIGPSPVSNPPFLVAPAAPPVCI